TDTVTSPVEIQGDGGAATFRNTSAPANRLLKLSDVSGVSTGTNVTTLYLDGTQSPSGTLETAVMGIVSDGTAGGKLAVVKDGTGTWTLSNAANSYTGGTKLNAGILRATAAASLGPGELTLAGGQLHLINNTNTTFGNNTLVTGDSTVATTKTSGATGDAIHSLGTLSIGTSTLSGIKFSATTNGRLNFGTTTLTGIPTFSPAGAVSLALGDINGDNTTGINKTGAGILILAADSPSYAGATHVLSGTLQVGVNTAAGTLGSGTVLVDAGATLLFAKNNASTFDNSISGEGAVRLNTTTAIITLTNASYTGTTQIQNGLLQTNSSASNLVLGTAGATFNYGILGLLSDFNGGLGFGAGSVTWATGNNVSGGFAVMDAATRNVNIGGNVSPDTLTVGTAGFVGGTLAGNNSRIAFGDVNGTALG
ncbi:MAG: hypothetical protein EOP85_18425, partial [Verrucomicrobiaceae bacterium]